MKGQDHFSKKGKMTSEGHQLGDDEDQGEEAGKMTSLYDSLVFIKNICHNGAKGSSSLN